MARRLLRPKATLYGSYIDTLREGPSSRQRAPVPGKNDPRGLSNPPPPGRYGLRPQEVLLRGRDLVAGQVPEVYEGPYI